MAFSPQERADAISRGAKKYFTGRACKLGHVAERRTSNGCCVVCEADKHQRWAKNNPEKLKEASIKSYAKHAEKRRQKAAECDRPTDTVFCNHLAHMEERDEIAQWYLDNPDSRDDHPLNDTEIVRVIPNKQGMHYIGPGPLLHRVVPRPYEGVRVSIGYDIIDDLNWTPMAGCSSEKGVCQAYPVFERKVSMFNTKLVPIPCYE